MEEMLDSFFEYSRLQAYPEALTLQRMPLYPLLCETLLSYYAQLHEQGLDPVLCCAAEDIAVMMDPDAMKRIFQNLIINTLRYGSAPFTIIIRQEKDMAYCTFSNQVDPAQIDTSLIFQRFYQGDRARQHSGSGLGMAIVSELCAQMSIHIQARLEGKLLLIDMEMKTV
ncbi:MAG TPA: HAMP domain-containing histidine kinase [Candidatus Merdibacter merdavium]|uniref:histidine kinase n=1 Tax=Candidatus Merdibacter merdavium TaxID=2838692 RepID=A0A9D2SVV3_9FIRM|nr:HAMP domain-containing histidine kinase [Candidatus Merdibacter merdavium]